MNRNWNRLFQRQCSLSECRDIEIRLGDCFHRFWRLAKALCQTKLPCLNTVLNLVGTCILIFSLLTCNLRISEVPNTVLNLVGTCILIYSLLTCNLRISELPPPVFSVLLCCCSHHNDVI